MKIKVAWIGKTKEPALQALTDEYLKRISRYAEIEGVVLRDEAALLKIREKPRPAQVLVLLDRGGKQLSSEEIATLVGDFEQRSALPLFAVGPADGFGDPVRKVAGMVLSLGKITLPHELARVVLLEQLYRALTILKGHPYHSGH